MAATAPSANPAPLGLLGFGMTTILLNIHNAGFYPISSMILAMGVFYGGIAQVIAGHHEYRKGNTFAFTAFTSYGFFWLVLVGIILAPKFGAGAIEKTPEGFMGWFLALWGIFTGALFVCTFRKNRALQVIFGSLTLLFGLLAIRDWTGSEVVGTVAGWEGIFCGASALYLGLAEVVNEQLGREVLPIGAVTASVSEADETEAVGAAG